MLNSKKFAYDYDDYEDGSKDASTMVEEILNDKDLKNLEEIIIGCWGECYDNSVQSIIDKLVENKDKVAHIKSLFVGDMGYEECEVSWIEQGNYSNLLDVLVNLQHLKIKGSNDLSLGKLNLSNLESLEIICGGLPKSVISEIANSNLTNLKKLNLYFGIDSYGFDGDINDIKGILKNENFKNLNYLGLGNSCIQDEIVEETIKSNILENLKTLDFSNGTLTDKGAQIILDNFDKIKHLEFLNLNFHYMSDEMMKKIESLPIKVSVLEQNELDEDYENYPMLTE